MKLNTKDRMVIACFVMRKPCVGTKLDTDGTRLDGAWLGGRGIAYWTMLGIHYPDLGSKAAEVVQRAVRRLRGGREAAVAAARRVVRKRSRR